MSLAAPPAVTSQVPSATGASAGQTTSIVVVLVQLLSQPSPLTLLPSSHSSPASSMPLPQSMPGSFWQVDEQPSPSAVLPSSHCSPASLVPSPHLGCGFSLVQVEEQPSPSAVLPSS